MKEGRNKKGINLMYEYLVNEYDDWINQAQFLDDETVRPHQFGLLINLIMYIFIKFNVS